MKRVVFLFILLVLMFLMSCASAVEVVNTTYIKHEQGYQTDESREILLRKKVDMPHKTEENKVNTENADEKEEDKQPEPPKEEALIVSYVGKAVVLTYHHISNNPFSGITIRPERFEEDLKMLRNNGFNVISMRQMLDAMDGRRALPENAVVITFDDGIESFYKYAFPLLQKYNMPAVQYIITSRTEAYMPSDAELNPLSPEEIKEMFESGLVDIQSHTHNSHDYVYINPDLKKGPKLTSKIFNPDTGIIETEDEYRARITEDLSLSREIIYKYIGVYPDMLCFPYGSYNKAAWSAGKSVGFKYFITTQHGYNKENSKKTAIYRIRSGDAELTSKELLKDIIECVNEVRK